MAKWLVALLVAVVIAGLVGLGVVYRVRYDRLEGFYAPIYAQDGSGIYFVHRETEGISWGLGYEHFTPPAHAYVLGDRFSLNRLDLESSSIEALKRWPASPLEGRHLRHYRGRLYAIPRVRLRWAENGGLEYTVAVSLPKVPRSESFGLRRRWNNLTDSFEETDSWQNGHFTTTGYNEDAVRDGKELMTPRGPQYYPLAILAVDHGSGGLDIQLESARYRKLFPNGMPEPRWLEERSIFAEVERLRAMRSAHAEALRRFKSQGLPEGEARLRTGKEMQRLGYYRKSDTITARRLSGSEAEAARSAGAIVIPDGEMQSGVFPDIEKAVAAPGQAIDKSMGKYVTHHDYVNSAKLNARIAAGDTKILIVYRGAVFELTIERH
ncbi:MAG: hypothetical protein QF893_11705 [Alphaproteobacteria bacterium]|jgi:hypothetical protein|nr:hypothetical protein [Alphaproteobacteria bacterium]